MNYKLIKNIAGHEIAVSYETETEKVSIPFDPANTDYQEYLQWLADGNTPEPVDSGE